jgi:hypothetical protein
LTARLNYWAIVAGTAATLLVSSVWYTVLGEAYLELRGLDSAAELTPEAGALAGQVLRSLVVATVLAHLLRRLQVTSWMAALRVGLLVWLGLQAMAVLGSVLHEQYPLGLYAIHVGDALVTTLTMTLILGTWRRGPARSRASADPHTRPGR